MTKGLLVRVGADQGRAGGLWNGPVDSKTDRFVYTAIPETAAVHSGHNKPYALLAPALRDLGLILPPHLRRRGMHLDPDFEHLTYGDQGERGKRGDQILTAWNNLGEKDDLMLVFYASLRDIWPAERLTYAIIGIFVVDEVVAAADVTDPSRWHENAHTRRKHRNADILVRARPGVSGRLERCIPIGFWRSPSDDPEHQESYRVKKSILDTWGGLSIRDGFIQRSAYLPSFLNMEAFLAWFRQKQVRLLRRNN